MVLKLYTFEQLKNTSWTGNEQNPGSKLSFLQNAFGKNHLEKYKVKLLKL